MVDRCCDTTSTETIQRTTLENRQLCRWVTSHSTTWKAISYPSDMVFNSGPTKNEQGSHWRRDEDPPLFAKGNATDLHFLQPHFLHSKYSNSHVVDLRKGATQSRAEAMLETSSPPSLQLKAGAAVLQVAKHPKGQRMTTIPWKLFHH